MLFFEKTMGRVTQPLLTAVAMEVVDAVAKTSTGAPARSCSTKAFDPAKLNLTDICG
jgi:hypothetical protein